MKMNKQKIAAGILLLMVVGLFGGVMQSVKPLGEVSQYADYELEEMADTEVSNKVIATVGDTKLTEGLFQEQLNYYKSLMIEQLGDEVFGSEEGDSILNDLKVELLTNTINAEVLFQKANELNMKASEEDIEALFESEKAGFKSDEDFNDTLKDMGITVEMLKQDMASTIKVQALMDHIVKDVEVDYEEVRGYYDENPAEFIIGEGALMKQILILKNSPEEDSEGVEDTSKEDIEAIYKSTATDSFESIFKSFSENGDKDSNVIAEDMSFIEYEDGRFDPLFLKGIRDVEEGTYSLPIESSFGWHIVFVEEIHEEEIVPFEEVEEVIREDLISNKKQQVTELKLEEWKKELNVMIYSDEYMPEGS